MTINTSQPCAVGERIDYLRNVETGEEPNVRMVVLSVATREDWDRDWPENPPPFRYGFFYDVSAD